MTREVGQGSGSSERMGGYDQFSSLQFYILHIIYAVCSFALSYYNMLYLSVLILQSSCLYYYLFGVAWRGRQADRQASGRGVVVLIFSTH